MMSIRWPGCCRNSPFAAMPVGQWAISGVLMPPSWTQCLYSRNGVFDTFAQPAAVGDVGVVGRRASPSAPSAPG